MRSKTDSLCKSSSWSKFGAVRSRDFDLDPWLVWLQRDRFTQIYSFSASNASQIW